MSSIIPLDQANEAQGDCGLRTGLQETVQRQLSRQINGLWAGLGFSVRLLWAR